MPAATTVETMSTELLKVAERAKREPQGRLLSLARLIDEEALKRAFSRIRRDAAVGIDGVTKEQYEQQLEDNVRELWQRMKAGRYRHQAIRRVHIPKGNGATRPIGISCLEDKLVQGAIKELLEAVYEPVFRGCSFGFRPGRSAHDAMRTLDGMLFRREVSWILEADIASFFDSIDRTKLKELLRLRIADESLLRLIGKCLHVGILDGESYDEPEEGTVQGSVLSPILGNVYLHYVLDLWVENEVRPRLRGGVQIVRYADDFVLGFEREEDARRVMAVIGKRFERFGLKLHPDKTRLLPIRRPTDWDRSRKGPSTFDFLGFTVHWKRTPTGRWRLATTTRKARLARTIQSIGEWCRRHRHDPVKDQHAALCSRLQGHYSYFGVNGNIHRLEQVLRATRYLWRKWLRRRSNRTRLTCKRFWALLDSHPLPEPRVTVSLWAR
jgi:group II intron reverse transcriptase/maturase